MSAPFDRRDPALPGTRPATCLSSHGVAGFLGRGVAFRVLRLEEDVFRCQFFAGNRDRPAPTHRLRNLGWRQFGKTSADRRDFAVRPLEGAAS